MPFYEYECQACKYYTEVMQKIREAPLTRCPSCGKRRLRKLVSAPVFRLKGGGWYETDFKSDKENKRNLLGADKDEPKPEVKAEPKEAKAEGKEAKESPPAADSKASEPKSAAGAAAPGSAARRSRVSVSGKAVRAAHQGRPARLSRGARRRGRRSR
jgi:putative FmdB family regulatory protein